MNVSFVIIAYNEARNIGRTLDGILAQEGLRDYEVVVVDDGSRDGTAAVVKEVTEKHRTVRLVALPKNRGRGAARAAGLTAAKGKYIAFVDADILLPKDWLKKCMLHMKTHDACGGTAVPDGDVSFVHRIFGLKPKVTAHSTTVTGSNGLFKRSVFDLVFFNPDKRDGEDVDLGHQIKAAGLATMTVPGLLVEHRETKTYRESMQWLFVSGKGASRQFYEHREIRLPDLAFFGFVGVLLCALVASFVWPEMTCFWIVALLAYLFASSGLYMYTKFELQQTPARSVAAIVTNMSLLGAYYIGRLVGFITERNLA
jgi:glycosyltransferase involved in cell wall biosynthesis